MAVDDGFVDWTTTTAVRRIGKTGGTAMTLFSSQGSGDTLMVQEGRLYWRNSITPNGVFWGPISGGQATMLVGGLLSTYTGRRAPVAYDGSQRRAEASPTCGPRTSPSG